MLKKIYTIRKIFLLFLFLFFSFVFTGVVANADTQSIVIGGKTITLKDGTKIQIDTDYVVNGTEFRAVWVSALTGDIVGFTGVNQYKSQIISVLDTLEYYNMNAIIFHVRMYNDAFYESIYNSWSSYYNTDPTWDALPWIIEECHKRGIEFHAWMNPYRVSSSASSDLNSLASKFKKSNAASNPNNLLVGSACTILNPGLPEVRSFLVNTCMELVQNYDVDAIHFDDYFYASGVDDSTTQLLYNTTGLSSADWRREQVDLFIQNLSKKLRAFNSETGRCVQLGISPTGVYRNGNGIVTYDANGVAITNGSATSAYAHYGSPLYADTLKWIENEWIDYILPQTYWGITNSSGPFCDLVSWWNKVVKYSNVNFYAALGLYMSATNGNASWSTNKLEGYYQAMYANSLDYCAGTSVYNYLSLAGSVKSKGSFEKVNEIWSQPIIPPEIRTMDAIVLDKANNLSLEKNDLGYKITFNKDDKAKFYVIYKSTSPITYKANEVLDVIGDISNNGMIEYNDIDVNNNVKYYYAVKVLSNSNTLSEGVTITTDNAVSGTLTNLGQLDNLGITDNLFEDETVIVFWDDLMYPLGTEVNYEITYTFDGVKYKTNNISSYKNMKCVYLSIPKNTKTLSVTIRSYNSVGESLSTINRDIITGLKKIANFGTNQEIYANEEAVFTFNSLQMDGVEYVLQYSYNELNWYDGERIIDNSDDFNLKIKSIVPSDGSKIYYRVKAIYNNSISYSNVQGYLLKSFLGDFLELKINDEDVTDYMQVIVNEGDDITITFKKNNSSSKYSVFYSTNLENWVSLQYYNSSYNTSITDDEVTITIPINYKYYKFAIYLSGTSGTLQNISPVIIFYCQLYDLYSEEVIKYMYDDCYTTIKQLNIFN